MIMRFRFNILFLFITSISIAQIDDAKLANEYFQQGDYEKALTIYEKISTDRRAIPLIHSNFLQLLIDQSKFKEAEKYLDKVLKYFPTNLQYQVDLVSFYKISDQDDRKKELLGKMLDQYQKNQYQLSIVAQNLVANQMYDEAIAFYLEGRKMSGRSSSFALDLAAIYRLKNDKPSMTEEYINYAEGNPANLSYVKNLFQNILNEDEDQEYLEQTLIKKIQKFPQQILYPDLLIWLELQRKNFYAAFIQARSIDKRTNSPGDESMQIGYIAYDNKEWEDAVDIFEYVIEEYGDSYNYAQARRLLIKSRESKIKSTYPVDRKAIQKLANEYSTLFQELGSNPVTLEALRNKALLHAFYLDELDTAITILNYIIDNRRTPPNLIAESKLDLGDMYLLINQPWESTLLYSQVEKSNKESPLGYQAKLRNARLNYFTGDFALAKSHLDILKIATTREISNDAIALSLLISDNTVLDTTDQVMQDFAHVELLLFQNKDSIAAEKLNALLDDNPGHSITDEIYWLQAKMSLEAGNYQEAIDLLDKIIAGYNYDILSDDAFFKKGIIFQEYLKKDEEAKVVFTEFLKNHPGSMYAAEARRRIRQLRGDLIN